MIKSIGSHYCCFKLPMSHYRAKFEQMFMLFIFFYFHINITSPTPYTFDCRPSMGGTLKQLKITGDGAAFWEACTIPQGLVRRLKL